MSDFSDPQRPTVATGALATASGPTPESKQERSRGLWADAFRQLRRRPTFIGPVLFLLVIASMAIFPSLWTSQSPSACNVSRGIRVVGPGLTSEHPFGFDVLGCDYYAKVIYGARPSLMIAVGATIGIVILGSVLGMLAGFFGGWVDAIISRMLDIVFALPFLVGAIVFLSVVRNRSELTIAMVLVVLGWTVIARLMRGSVIQARSLDYVQAARALGASNSRLMFTHILPNAVAPVVVYATIALGAFVSVEATLSFLGVGLIPPDTSWGILIDQNQDLVKNYPLLLVFPVIFLVGTVLSFILLGDALRDALDPKLR